MSIQDHVRILRIIEYVGPRDLVEEQVKRSIHGSSKGITDKSNPQRYVTITATTLGSFPEILTSAEVKQEKYQKYNPPALTMLSRNEIEVLQHLQKGALPSEIPIDSKSVMGTIISLKGRGFVTYEGQNWRLAKVTEEGRNYVI